MCGCCIKCYPNYSKTKYATMRLIWGFVVCLIQLWSASGQSFKTKPEVELPRSFTLRSVREAFTRAQDIISTRRSTLSERRSFDPWSNIPSARHQFFQRINGRSLQSESAQEPFEEATRILLNEYNLTKEQVTLRLSEIDLHPILQGNEVQNCETQFNFHCNAKSPYRNHDGTCNNLRNPSWGMASACFERLIETDYADGTAAKRVAISGNPLPPPRTISLVIHEHLNRPTNFVNQMFMVFGQFLFHDLSLTPLSSGPNNQSLECCPVDEDDPPQCDPIILGSEDPFFSSLGIDCLNNVRSAICSTCSLGPRQQINQATSYIDASHIYGLSQNISAALRNNDGSGTLRSTSSREGGELPPPSAIPNDDFCSFQDPNLDCFETGDQRANQHPALTSMHILFLREHNQIARKLRELNRDWDDERIYQETRRIVAAFMQNITYKEFLPLLIGTDRMNYFQLFPGTDTRYDSRVQATLVNEFSGAAFRFGHSMINSLFPQLPRRSYSSEVLRDIFMFPFGLYRGELDGLIKGTLNSPGQWFDRHMVRDVTNHLYQQRGNASGLDLASLNINRARDHGIPSYITFLKFCSDNANLTPDQFHSFFPIERFYLVKSLYENVRDIDLFTGGLTEVPHEGAVVGPTFACIIGTQFQRLKYGDRFYFEHRGQAGSFTKAQLREIRKVSLKEIICRNSNIDASPAKAMVLTRILSPTQYCDNSPEFDLTAWKVS